MTLDRLPRLIAVGLLVTASCADPSLEAQRDDPLAEEIAGDDGNAGEPSRSQALASVSASSCGQGANGGWHHCSAACPCDAGEGDCDGSDECASGLTCVKNIGATYGWDPDVDVCEDTCHPSANGGFHYCSAACPCDAGEGDCDGNGECLPGLTCVKDVGPNYGWDGDVDVCEDTCHPSANGGFDYCSAACPCANSEGDCDSNRECLPGLTCVKDVGPQYGWDSDIDVCEGQCDDTGGTCRPGCPCDPQGTSLFLQVFALDGPPIATAAVTMEGTLHVTDGVGRILFEHLAPGRLVARVEASGFAPASVAVELHEGAHAGIEIRLRPLGAPIAFDAESGATIEDAAVRVSIPPGSLVDHLGQPVTGTVEATIVPLDPGQARSDTLPGPLQGLAASTGAAVELESVVMAEVSLWQDGLPVQLAPGARATMELMLPDAVAGQYQIGQSIPAWWLDLDAGVWKEEGAGTIEPSAVEPGKLAWVVEVGHFTWWNCDAPWTEKHCFRVTVRDTAGNPVPNLRVGVEALSYAGTSTPRYTGSNGQACVEIMRDGTAHIIVGPPGAPLATRTVAGEGPAADCAGNGAPCTPVLIQLGTDMICTPGSSQPCPYSGPAGTQGVGVCRASTSQCNAAGTARSACEGEVLPRPETCASPFDDDCDGEVDDGVDCSGCNIGDEIDCYTGHPDTLDVGICRAGRQTCGFTRVFGPCTGQILPQPESCETAVDDNCDGSTSCVGMTGWSRRFGGVGFDFGQGIAVDSAGNVLASGIFSDTVDFDGGPYSAVLFLVKMDGNGRHVWSRDFPGFTSTDHTFPYMLVATDSADNVLLAGKFQGTVDFGGGPLTSTGDLDMFAAKLGPQGQHLWSRHFEGTTNGWPKKLTVDRAGNVLLAGEFAGTVDFGGGPITSTGESFDGFVVKLDAQGQHLWDAHFSGTYLTEVWAIATDGAGNVFVTGDFHGTTYFGGPPLTNVSFIEDVYVVKLNAQGQHLWSRGFGSPDFEMGQGIAVDSAGNVLVAGSFEVEVDFGGGPLVANGGNDVFVVRLDAQGQHLWSRRYGGTRYEQISGLAVDGADNLLITGRFLRMTDFGGGPLFNSTGSYLNFVVKLDAQGQHVWSRLVSTMEYEEIEGMAVDGAGHMLVTGRFGLTSDFGSGPLTSAGYTDAFVVKINP